MGIMYQQVAHNVALKIKKITCELTKIFPAYVPNLSTVLTVTKKSMSRNQPEKYVDIVLNICTITFNCHQEK